MVFGSFDPLHEGHINFFKQAKQFGDYLIVVVAREKSIIRIKNHIPRFSEEERLSAVKRVSLVDKAVLGDENNYGRVIEDFKPEIIAIGYDQEIPETLKNTLKKYKIITLKPFRPDIYKSSKV
jgi:FAD synthetase